MINKIAASVANALADVHDGATVMIGGFGTAGIPDELIDGLIAQGAKDLTVVNNNAGNGDTGLAALLKAGRVRKIICSFPRQADSYVFDELYRSRKLELELELELVPQRNLAERGNLMYRKAVRTFGLVMATNCRKTAATVFFQKCRFKGALAL
jgi:3-oxoadipate CoA-transferase alpha subunit